MNKTTASAHTLCNGTERSRQRPHGNSKRDEFLPRPALIRQVAEYRRRQHVDDDKERQRQRRLEISQHEVSLDGLLDRARNISINEVEKIDGCMRKVQMKLDGKIERLKTRGESGRRSGENVPVSVSRPNLHPGCPLTHKSLRGSQDDMVFAEWQRRHRAAAGERQREAISAVMEGQWRTDKPVSLDVGPSQPRPTAELPPAPRETDEILHKYFSVQLSPRQSRQRSCRTTYDGCIYSATQLIMKGMEIKIRQTSHTYFSKVYQCTHQRNPAAD